MYFDITFFVKPNKKTYPFSFPRGLVLWDISSGEVGELSSNQVLPIPHNSSVTVLKSTTIYRFLLQLISSFLNYSSFCIIMITCIGLRLNRARYGPCFLLEIHILQEFEMEREPQCISRLTHRTHASMCLFKPVCGGYLFWESWNLPTSGLVSYQCHFLV